MCKRCFNVGCGVSKKKVYSDEWSSQLKPTYKSSKTHSAVRGYWRRNGHRKNQVVSKKPDFVPWMWAGNEGDRVSMKKVDVMPYSRHKN